MDPERWQRLESLCFDALERRGPERAAWLDRECAGDEALRREAQSLLDHLEADPSFLERPIVDRPDRAPPSGAGDDPLPSAIGPYRLVRRLGRGGMSDVYLAVQEVEDVRQSVAVKVIRRGRDTDDVLRHFRQERRILAGLGHPNIARLVDAGATEDGLPYFVMEYVEGRPVDAHCDAHRLSIERRLELFRVICDAVQHAHRKLVVHRDLKPSNILVDDAGVPKLLDFGIGKVLDESGAFGTAVETRTEVRLLTPAHAAPEQIRGEPVSTATDIYALGVLLYQLLAGRHPYVSGGETLAEIERTVLETNPLPPSAAVSGPTTGESADATPARAIVEIASRRAAEPGQLRRRLAGDLDNIVLAGMRQEPERRYASATALADDIGRHLAGRPVRARPDTVGYRARKFVRRNAARVAAAVVVVVALGATTAVTLVQSRRVAREAELVTRERDKALEVRGFLMEMFGATGADRTVGDSVTARRLLDLQAASLDQAYGDRPELRAEMLEVLADGYDRLGLLDAAEPLAREALALRRRTAGPGHPDVASSLNLLGWILHEKGGSAEAEPLLREAAAIRRSAGPRYSLDLSRSLNDLGVVLTPLGRHEEAEAVLDEALSIRRGSLGETHRSVGITASNLAVTYFHRARLDDAIRLQELAVRALLQSVGADHQRSIIALGNLAAFRQTAGDWVGAEREYRELLERQIGLRGRDDPQTANVMRSLGIALQYRGAAMAANASGPPAEAEALLAEAELKVRDALAVFEARLGPSHPEVAATLGILRAVLVTRGDVAGALPVQERAVRIFRSAFGDANANTARALSDLAGIRWRMNDIGEAVRLQRQALATLEQTAGPTHPATAQSRSALCHWLSLASEALPFCVDAERDLSAAPAAYQAQITVLRLRLAQAHLETGNRESADSILARVAGAVDAGDGGGRARRLFDSLTAVLARQEQAPTSGRGRGAPRRPRRTARGRSPTPCPRRRARPPPWPGPPTTRPPGRGG